MAKVYKMKMLWHSGFWDHPLSGLGEYQGEKVWFYIDNNEDVLKEEDYTDEIRSIINNYKFNEEDDDRIGSTDDYEIYYFEGYDYKGIDGKYLHVPAYFSVRHKLTYKIYRLPTDVLNKIIEHEKLWSEYGIHNMWHDPAKFQPFNGQIAKLTDYYENNKTNPLRVNKDDLVNYECLGIIKYDEIEWFHRPM